MDIKGTAFNFIDINDESYSEGMKEFNSLSDDRNAISDKLSEFGFKPNNITNGKIIACGAYIPDFILINEKRRIRSRWIKIFKYANHTDEKEFDEIRNGKWTGEFNPTILWENDIHHIVNTPSLGTAKSFCNTYSMKQWRGLGSFWALDIKEVSDFYSNHSRKETSERFNVDEIDLRRFLKYHFLQRAGSGFYGDKLTSMNRLNSLHEFFQDDKKVMDSHIKASDTMEQRYGDRKYNLTKSMETMQKKYGVKHGMQIDGFQEKSQKTMLYRYGVETPLRNKELLNKARRTNLEKYGDLNPLGKKSSARSKRDKTMLDKYGCLSPLQNQMFRDKMEETVLEKYGVPNSGLIHYEDKESKEELSLNGILSMLGFVHNDMDISKHAEPLFFKLKYNGKIINKCPDYVNFNERVVVEYNGAYWHKDSEEQKRWLEGWTNIGWRIAVIWDFERKEFLMNPPKSLDELLSNYPCTYR